MPVGNPEAYNDPIVQQLVARGLLATGGNIRSVPFSNEVTNGATANGSPPSSASGSAVRNADGTYNVTDANGNEQTIDVAPVAQQMGEDTNSDLSWLALALAAGGGGALGYALAKNRQRGVSGTADGPTVNPNMTEEIVDGEFSPVRDPLAPLPDGTSSVAKELAAPQRQIKGGQKAITAPSPALGSRNRATNPPQPSAEQSRIVLPDEMSDLTPDEMSKARALAEQLVMNRQKGNVRSYKPGVKGVGPQHLPTSPNRSTETVDAMLGNVVRMIREGKIKPSQLRMLVP